MYIIIGRECGYMQFYDVIKNRESIKQFKSDPVDESKLTRIVNAVMMSPSWKNNSSYRLILIDNMEEKNKLSKTIINDTNEASKAILQAPVVAVVVADPSQSGIVGDKEYYLVDGAIAMEHFVLAATNEGYGTCWIAAVNEDMVRQVLNIPENYRVVAMTPLGETAVSEESQEKKDISEYIFLNSWGESYPGSNSNQLT